MDTPFVIEQVYHAPMEKVWQALTEKDKMKGWYFPQLTKFKPTIGFKFEFTHDGSPFQKAWQVTNLIEGRLLAHSWTYIGYPGSSEVTFELVEAGDYTKLRLTHTGLATFPSDPHFARQRFENGWKQILGTNLKKYLEK